MQLLKSYYSHSKLENIAEYLPMLISCSRAFDRSVSINVH